MSRARGVVPLLLATGFGIANGIAIFGPSFKEQQQEREEQERKTQEIARLIEEEGVDSLRSAEAAASRAGSTEKALRTEHIPNSWWSKMNLWSAPVNPALQESLPHGNGKELLVESSETREARNDVAKRN